MRVALTVYVTIFEANMSYINEKNFVLTLVLESPYIVIIKILPVFIFISIKSGVFPGRWGGGALRYTVHA
jgi:hypothetical protein